MIYIIHVVLFQLAFYCLYFLFKKDTFYKTNRLYLLVGACLTYTLPLVKLNLFRSSPISNSIINKLPTVFIENNNDAFQSLNKGLNFNWCTILILGSICMFFLFVLKIWKLVKLIKNNRAYLSKGIKFVELENYTSAFSYFQWVFVGSKLNNSDKDIVIAHELIHIEEKHSWDIMFFEIQRIFFWFSPFVYLLQKEIKALHEFSVDQQMIQRTSKQAYCQGLLTQMFNTPQLSLINTFYKKSLIKKRIAMITKKESTHKARLKYGLIFPVVIGLLLYTSCNQDGIYEIEGSNLELNLESQTKEALTTNASYEDVLMTEIEKVPIAAVAVPPIYPDCEETEDLKKCFHLNLRKHITENFDTALGEKGINRLAAVFVINIEGNVADIEVKSKNENEKLEIELKRVLELLPKMKPSIHNGKICETLYQLPLVFKVE